MRSPKGYFYFQKRPRLTVRTPFMRWSQAWMLLALATLLDSAEAGVMIECVFTVDYEIYGNGQGSLRELVLRAGGKAQDRLPEMGCARSSCSSKRRSWR